MINRSSHQLLATMNHLQSVMGATEKGDFSQRMDPHYGKTLADTINATLNRLETVFSDIGQTIAKAAQGDFNSRVHYDGQGGYATLREDINTGFAAINTALEETCHVAKAMAEGDLRLRIQGQQEGSLLQLKNLELGNLFRE